MMNNNAIPTLCRSTGAARKESTQLTHEELRTVPFARQGEPSKQDSPGEPSQHLLVVSHPDPEKVGQKITLQAGKTLSVGRSEAADASFPGVESMSRMHAEIESDIAGVAIRDRDSTNGVVVNEEKVTKTLYLHDGDVVELGEIILKVVTDAATQQAETLYRLVNTDELTGAFNLRRFREVIAAECARAERYERPLSLILFDIDEFKSINDTYGHPVGDEVLKGVVALAASLHRKGDMIARLGGDEFAIICPESAAEHAALLAERIRRGVVDELRVSALDVRVSCSFGVAGIDTVVASPEALQVAADQALYRSKDRGRNEVSVATADS